MAKLVDDRGASFLGLFGPIAEILARAFVDDNDRNGAERIAVLACERGIGERQHDKAERDCPNRRAAATGHEQQERKDYSGSRRSPKERNADKRGERDTEIHRRAPIALAV